MNVVAFRRRPDLDELVVDLFVTLATCRGSDIAITCRQFRDEHPNLRPSDLAAAFALTHRIVAIFERHLADAGGGFGDGGAA
jgi:hypothetical protein